MPAKLLTLWLKLETRFQPDQAILRMDHPLASIYPVHWSLTSCRLKQAKHTSSLHSRSQTWPPMLSNFFRSLARLGFHFAIAFPVHKNAFCGKHSCFSLFSICARISQRSFRLEEEANGPSHAAPRCYNGNKRFADSSLARCSILWDEFLPKKQDRQ